MEFTSLQDVLVDELGELYSAEEQLIAAIPTFAAAAHSYDLRETLEGHLEETRVHVQRLEAIFDDLGIRFMPTKTSKAMRGLIEQGEELTRAAGDSVALDAALIGAAQRIEQYEIAAYGTARALAGELGLGTASSLLGNTIDEEARANKTLTKLASGGMLSSGINRLAADRSRAPDEDEIAADEAVASSSVGGEQ